MIEVNLFSISSADPVNSMTGRCISRSRFNKESMGVSVMEYLKEFLKDNLDQLETAIGNSDLVSLINSAQPLTIKDFQSIQYFLGDLGYTVKIWNVAEDEVNKTSIPEDTKVEWNVIDHSFTQYDYPTATKIIPDESQDIVDILTEIVDNSGLFDKNKFEGIRNPFTSLINNLKQEKELTGNISAGISARIYMLLGQLGIDVFCATPEHS